MGLLTEGLQCCMSGLINGHVPCQYFTIFMSKMVTYTMLILGNALGRFTYFFSHITRLHVNF